MVVRDDASGEHTLTARFTQLETTVASQVRWEVMLLDGTTEVGSGELRFISGHLDPTTAKLSIDYRPQGKAPMPLTLDFTADVTSNAAGALSDLRLLKQDGYAAGELSEVAFDAEGVLNLTYSNSQTDKGVRLAIARFNSADDVRAIRDNLFVPVNASTWEAGAAKSGAFGEIRSGSIELSNVNLSSEFSELVIMQRGYQASSQVVSTANEMIQELFSLKGR